MAWQVGVAQTVPLVCYLDGVSTAPTAPIVTEVNVEGAGYVAATNAATIQGDAGEVAVLLDADEMGAWGFVRVTGDNGSQGIQPFTSEGDWTATRAGYTDKLNVPGTLTHTGNVATAPANLADLKITPSTGRVDIGAVGGTAVDDPTDLMADVSALALEETLTSMKGSTFDDSTDSLEAIRNRGDAAWITGGGSGTGTRTMVFTLSDGAGTLAGNLKTQVEDSEGNLVAGPQTTDSLGQVTYRLDDGSYSLVSASSTYWQGNSESVTVSASAAVAVTLTAQSLPVPSSADKYTVIIDCADEYGDLVGASAWAIKVLNVLPRGLSTANLVQLTEQNAITTDANGRATFEIAQETTSLTVSITPTLADNSNGDTLTFTVEVSADDADESGIIYFADLLHR